MHPVVDFGPMIPDEEMRRKIRNQSRNWKEMMAPLSSPEISTGGLEVGTRRLH